MTARYKLPLNAIRYISHINWRADREVLPCLYRALILSKIDYRCAAYFSARKSNLKLLDVVHNTGIRYVTEALH